MSTLKMDFGITTEDVLNISDRDGVLLALHLFQMRKPEAPSEVCAYIKLTGIIDSAAFSRDDHGKVGIYSVIPKSRTEIERTGARGTI